MLGQSGSWVNAGSSALGGKYVRTTRFFTVSSGTSGTVTLPPNSTIVLDDFGGTTDALVSGLQGGKPTLQSPLTSLGVPVATSFDSSGNYVFTGTPASYPVAVIYRVEQTLADFDSTNPNIIGTPNFMAQSVSWGAITGTLSNQTDLQTALDAKLPLATFEAYNDIQKEPTGFENAFDTSITFNDATRTFTILPVGSDYDFYVKGVKFTKSASISAVIPDITGNHYIYFDSTGTLVSTMSFVPAIITDNAFVSIVYWNASVGARAYFANERHGLVMDGGTHAYLHTIFGARFLSGGALENFTVDASGNLDPHAQFDVDQGSIRDEDLLIQYPYQAQIPILYRVGTAWRKKAADGFPVIYSGSAGYTGASGRLAYNLLSAGSFSLAEVPNNSFVLVHFFATNDVDNPVVGIQGITTYGSISAARTGAVTEITSLTGLPFAEFVALGSVIFETASTYSNTVKARVRSTDTGADYVDFRGTQTYTPSGAVASSHSLLSNLANDDHLQYHNDARGDVRYYTKTQVDTSLSGKANLSGGNIFSGTQDFGLGVVDKFKGNVVFVTSFPYDLNNADTGKILVFNTSTDQDVELRASSEVGFNCAWVQYGTGKLTFVPMSGATLRHVDSFDRTRGQYAMGALTVVSNAGGSSAEYVLSGDCD